MLLNENVSKLSMEKRFGGKKGISPLIATVILVCAVVVIAVGVWLLFSGIVIGNIQKVDCGIKEQIAQDISASCSINGNTLDVKVTNVGNSDVDAIRIVSYYQDGSASGIPPSGRKISPGEEFIFSYNNPRANGPESVEVIPGVIKEEGEGHKLVLCIDKLQQVK